MSRASASCTATCIHESLVFASQNLPISDWSAVRVEPTAAPSDFTSL